MVASETGPSESFHSHLVTTPSRRMIFGCENWPMMLASLKKSCLCFSEYPSLRVLIATGTSPRTRFFITPRKTSPNSPDLAERKQEGSVRATAPRLHCHGKQTTVFYSHTHADGFLFADGDWVYFSDKLLDCNVRVLVHVRINVSLQGLELICVQTNGSIRSIINRRFGILGNCRRDARRLHAPGEK